ncbi:MAG: hypothetical protein IKL47_12805 [Clostridia bacterium]|nr:hypothetical protein [Clostridia bacterium]
MDEEKRQKYIEKMVDNLPMLRKKLGLTQQGLANIIGVSSYTVLAIEKKQRKMTWSTFLSVLIVCLTKEEVRQILTALNIYTNELIEFIEGKR